MMGEKLTQEALHQINTVKQDSYGKPEDSFESIARRWTEYLHNKYHCVVSTMELTPEDVAFMMMELKMARESNQNKRDNLVDLIGYACLKEKLNEIN